MEYTVHKYSGGTFCGMAEGRRSIDECMEYADDGFCDYARIQKARDDGTVQVIKVHFEPTERDDGWYKSHDY